VVRGREAFTDMRILKTVQAYEPFREMGGAVVKVRAIAHGLAQRGHSVTVLTADLGLSNRDSPPGVFAPSRWGHESHYDRVRAVYLPIEARYRALTWNPAAGPFAAGNLCEFDAVHIYGLYDLLGPPIAKSCRALGVPYVIEPMGMFCPIVRNIALKRLYHKTLGQKMIRGARHLIATSPQEQADLAAANIPADKIILRRNGLEFPLSLPAEGTFRVQWKIPSHAALVLFLGRVVSKKSPDLLIEAFAVWRNKSPRGTDAVLVIAGPEEGDGYQPQLRRLASKLGIAERVIFTGALYDDAKWAAYRDADVFALPSQNENFGNSAGESVAAGVPVILTTLCGIAPLLENRAAVVIPHDREKLTDALHALLDTPALRARLAAGCADVARDLTWAQPLTEMEEMYARMISSEAG